jgi:RNA polymerase primary sigma factor
MTAIKGKKAKKTVKTNDEDVLAMYLRELNRIPLLSRTEEDEAARAAAQGNRAAWDKLVKSNLRFVINVAKQYQGKGLPLPDLISEGNIGLMQAVDRFDADRGYHFISYAVWWIRQTIIKAINDKARMIRLPQNRANELFQIEKTRQIIQDQENIIDEIKEIARFLNMDAELVQDLLNISREMVSLESPVQANRDNTVLGDLIEDERSPAPYQNVLQGIIAEEIESILVTLDDREAEIIRSRYGLGRRPVMTLKEIGERYNLTKERIRQIENKALHRLQHPARMKRLHSYVA